MSGPCSNLCWICSICVVLPLGSTAILGAGEVDFNRQIRPILAENCLHCHGPDAAQRGGDLRLDDPESTHEIAINIETPIDSELLRRISIEDVEQVMPPRSSGKSLTVEQLELIRRWVSEGAPFQQHWAFQPILSQPVPVLRDSSGAAGAIDRYLLAKLRARGLDYSPSVGSTQLIRRAYFDLVGLPPTWDEVQAFVRDSSPDAYAKLINRLLDSPAYGERWGKHWLDLARYADTHGGAAIGFTAFPFSYTYRDYVVNSFNSDTPYDQFITEQLAADQLDLDAHSPKLAGLGFLTVGMQFRNAHDTLDDQIDVITRGLMGLTVACARCHDHKFDEIPTRDYYAIYAALSPSRSPSSLPVIGETADAAAKEQYERQLRDLEIQLEDFVRDSVEVMRARLRMQVGLYLREIAKGMAEHDVSTGFLSYRTDDLRPLVYNRWLEYLKNMATEDPVFGPWVRFQSLVGQSPEQFRTAAEQLLGELEKSLEQTGWKAERQHALDGPTPKHNPKVIAVLQEAKPASMLDVADAYGELFSEVNQQWLQAKQQAALEAVDENSVIADTASEHDVINSPVYRQLRRHLYGTGSPTALPDDEASRLTNRTISNMIGGKRGAIHQLHLSAGSPPRAMVLREDLHPATVHIFERGNPVARGAQVEPNFLSALPTLFEEPQPGKRRLALARAITAPSNPLTRRVLVNWVWQHHFGQGLVTTSDDFGTRGVAPTHPELLDYLADQFCREGWSIKALHRQIMLSKAYQQSGVEDEAARSVDPDNSLLWRMPRRRLDFEAMRDSMLAVSGELDQTLGGRPVDLEAAPSVTRRSVYGFVNRDIVAPLMSTFDGANPNACTVKRPETTVPQQTLFALNSNFIQDRAAKLQAWMLSLPQLDDAQRAIALYRRILSRNPSQTEIDLVLEYVSNESTLAGAKWLQVSHTLLASNEFVFLD